MHECDNPIDSPQSTEGSMPHCLVVANAIAVKSNKYTTRRILKDGRFLADLLLLHSMIGYWHHPVVRLSVHLSVCDAVHSDSQGWCTLYWAKSYTSVFLAGMFLFVPSDTFSAGCIV